MPLPRQFLQLAALLCHAPVATAGTDPSTLCLQAAAAAAERHGIPYEVLLAVSVVETGRNHRPWPWTVNLGGDGRWLQTKEQAGELVAFALQDGQTNIDLGCFQLNYRWHAEAFASVADMLDPWQNADYAAAYLAEQHARTGDWSLAAAAYHSATPTHAERYQARFETVLAQLDAPTLPDVPVEAAPRVNGFPLLVAGDAGSNGSLVPATSGGFRLIGEP